ncbi:Uncharacterised protein [uncultured archaeon]|nr:Uncharacterised protein [uncultured archaeon]
MREMFIKNKGILIPFFKNESLKTFENISETDRNITRDTINSIITQNKLSSRRKSLQNWTDYLYKKLDPASHFLAAQINLVLSSPELVRNELMDREGNILKVIEEKENDSLSKLQKYYLISDLPAIFSINANLYYYYLCQLEPNQNNVIKRKDFINCLETSGKMLIDDKHELIHIFSLFENYCNKPLAGLPIETFLINYVYQLFYEFTYEQRASLTNIQFKNFCNKLGEYLIILSKSLKSRDYNKTYNELYNITELINNNVLLENRNDIERNSRLT